MGDFRYEIWIWTRNIKASFWRIPSECVWLIFTGILMADSITRMIMVYEQSSLAILLFSARYIFWIFEGGRGVCVLCDKLQTEICVWSATGVFTLYVSIACSVLCQFYLTLWLVSSWVSGMLYSSGITTEIEPR